MEEKERKKGGGGTAKEKNEGGEFNIWPNVPF